MYDVHEETGLQSVQSSHLTDRLIPPLIDESSTAKWPWFRKLLLSLKDIFDLS